MQPETRFKVQVLKDLRMIPRSWWVKVQQVALVGTPDILGCIGRRFVALELKRAATEAPDPMQLYNLNLIVDCGGLAMSANPDSWPGIRDYLRGLAIAAV